MADEEQNRFELLQNELRHAFSQPETDYVTMTADDVFKRNRTEDQNTSTSPNTATCRR